MLDASVEVKLICMVTIVTGNYAPWFCQQNVNLYAEVNGKVMPVTVSSDDAKYQVSLKNKVQILSILK